MALHEWLGVERALQLLSLVLEDPGALRKGGPDLTLARGDRCALVEIKTTDRLHASQIRTLSRTGPLIGPSIAVCQLIDGSAEEPLLVDWLAGLGES